MLGFRLYNYMSTCFLLGGRSLDGCSYWVPEMDCNLYFVIVSKSNGNGTCGMRLEKNIHIGGLTVTDVTAGSMADASHLQKLDVIRTVDGENICSKSVAAVQQLFDSAEKRFILGIVRSNQSVVKQNIDILMKREPGHDFDFRFICGEMWPRFLGDSDCYISEITPGGLADRLGLKVGDTLIRVNGKSLQRLEYGEVMRVLLPELNGPNGALLTVKRAEFE